MDRTILIGDLHGCADECEELLRKLSVSHDDRVLFLGDYVDRGPENARCCDIVRHREQVQGSAAGILGNHEETHLRYCDMERLGALKPHRIPPTHVATRTQLRPEHYEWFRSLPLFVRVPEHNVVAVHAGCWPERPIEQQAAHHLLHVQMIRPYDKWGNLRHGHDVERSVWPSKVPTGEDGWRFWTHFWDGPETVVFGHSVLTKPLITDRVVGIDGGAVFGYDLHAYVLPERKVVSVRGKADRGRGKRGRGDDHIRKFPIHGDVETYS